MAKGDDARARNRIDFEGNRGRQLGENLRVGTLEPNVSMFRDQYFQPQAQRQVEDYGNIMGGYQDFAKTGGLTPEGISAIRARAISPIRSIYSNANREVDRQRSLQGGYAPGFNTAKARMARESSSAISDATTNAEAAIAELVQRGRLSGLTGASGLYSATPGMASTFGNQVLNASAQLGQGVSNEMGFGNDLARLQIASSQIPGKWENTMGRINDIVNLGKNVAGAASPWLGGGSSILPSGSVAGTGNINSGLYSPPTFSGYGSRV